jgi:hypothetical protein
LVARKNTMILCIRSRWKLMVRKFDLTPINVIGVKYKPINTNGIY